MYSPGSRQSNTPGKESFPHASTPKFTKENKHDFTLETARPPPSDTQSARFFRAASVPLRSSTSLTNFLNPPIPPSKLPTTKEKSCGKCLTSAEGLRQIEEKERLKEEKLRLKQEVKERKAKVKIEKQMKKKKKKPRQGVCACVHACVTGSPSTDYWQT